MNCRKCVNVFYAIIISCNPPPPKKKGFKEPVMLLLLTIADTKTVLLQMQFCTRQSHAAWDSDVNPGVASCVIRAKQPPLDVQ